MNKMKNNKLFRLALGFLMSVFLCTSFKLDVQADTYTEMMRQFPGVTVSDYGTAWTTDYQMQADERHPYGYTRYTGVTATRDTLGPGEHYYEDEAATFPISKWTVKHPPAQCIHDEDWPHSDFYGFPFGRDKCFTNYSSGWFATCALCNEQINFLIYGRESTIGGITFMPGESAYAYLCPYCNNLEQAVPYTHMCESFISKNYYRVQYIANYPSDATGRRGLMVDTKHMVGNATVYEGQPASVYGYTDTRLRKNSYKADGYVFTGWNTRADGTGTAYTDEQVINLCPDMNGANIILFAQWRRTQSTLALNTNGGSYAGYTGPITQGYGSTWTFSASKVTPPGGYRVTFNHMGGSGTAYINSAKTYAGKTISSPTHGRFVDDVYSFLGNNTTDTITLQFTQNSITLPTSTRSGYSFGGWYSDSACTIPVGVAGTTYTPTGNVTLYAKWVGLILTSVDDYTSNSGKGAVDLTWSQPDGTDKNYQIFQYSELDANHKIINSAVDIGTSRSVSESFGYTGAANTYTVPYSGYYTLTLNGAQGGNYGSYTGGKGGKTTATIYLKAGEVLTYNIGGQNGYNGGGSATNFGVGGGFSSVSSNLKGTLLIAGGGGGATGNNNGGSGGGTSGLLTTGTGGSGGAGGGGGYLGGQAGEATPGATDSREFAYTGGIQEYVAPVSGTYTLEVWGAEGGTGNLGNITTGGITSGNAKGGYSKGSLYLDAGTILYVGIGGRGLDYTYHTGTGYGGSYPVYVIPGGYNGGGMSLAEPVSFMTSGGSGGGATHIAFNTNRGELKNYVNDRSEVLIVAGGGGGGYGNYYNTWEVGIGGSGGGASGGAGASIYNEASNITASGSQGGTQTTGYAFGEGASIPYEAWDWYELRYVIPGGGGGGWYGGAAPTGTYRQSNGDLISQYAGGGGGGGAGYVGTLSDAAMEAGVNEGNGKAKISYQLADVYSPSYGGSSYINEAFCRTYSYEAGQKEGNGAFSIVSAGLGFHDSTTLNDVVAPDRAKPDTIAMSSVVKTSLNKTTIRVSFDKPADNGTKYYHYVKSYNAVTGAHSLTSNTTLNTLTTGVVKYHYVYDSSASTTVTTSHSSTANRYVDVTYPASGSKYLHIAAVDKAGNISGTIHIQIKAAGQDGSIVFVPKPVTEQVGITMSDGVATGADAKTYYVRSDGLALIELKDKAYLTDDGSRAYAQVDTVRFNVCNTSYGVYEWSESLIPYAPGTGAYTYANAQLQTNAASQSRMLLAEVEAARAGKDNVTVSHKYTIPSTYDGQTFLVYPGAYTTYNYRLYSSVDSADRNNYLKLICDGKPPVINGLDAVRDIDVMDMTEESKTFTLTASDAISGLADFALTIDNRDNYISRSIKDEDDGAKDGVITLIVPRYYEGSEDGLEFCGDFSVTVYAADNVGNVTTEVHDATGVAIDAEITRILAPHNPIFKCGESGMLTITTWGYVDKVEVEFPEELVSFIPELNKAYIYDNNQQYTQTESVEFMIPLYFPEGEYQITVKGYKAGTDLENHPKILSFTVKGSVLDELRTRLR